MEEGVQDGVCTYLKGKGILIPAAPWVNFEDTVLSEMSRHGRTNTIQIHFSEVPRGVRYIETGGRVVAHTMHMVSGPIHPISSLAGQPLGCYLDETLEPLSVVT